MRKQNGILICILAPLFAVAGFFLRQMEISTIFDEYTGLAELWHRQSLVLIGLSVFAFLLCLLLSFGLPKQMSPDFRTAFGELSAVSGVLALMGAIVAGASFFALVGHFFEMYQLGIFFFWSIGGILAGLCMIEVPIAGATGKNVSVFAAIPVFWSCAWLILLHIRHAADPVLIRYVYTVLAIGFLLLALYYIASAAFTKGNMRRQLFCSGMGIYFSGAALADTHNTTHERVIIAALAVSVLLYALLLMKNAGKVQSPAVGRQEDEGDNIIANYDG